VTVEAFDAANARMEGTTNIGQNVSANIPSSPQTQLQSVSAPEDSHFVWLDLYGAELAVLTIRLKNKIELR
jgi:hypothetical protein